MFVLPFRHYRSNTHAAWVVYGLIGINFLVWLVVEGSSSISALAPILGFVPADPSLTTAFTSMFLHDGLVHILGNMIFLLVFGEIVEEALGHAWTLALYLASGLVGAGLFYLVAGGEGPCIGASGAVSGIVGAYWVLYPTAKMDLMVFVLWIRVGQVATSAAVAIGAWILEQALLSLSSRTLGIPAGVAFEAHVGGMLAGAALGFVITSAGLSASYLALADRLRSGERCPRCGVVRRRPGAGRFLCPACRAWFDVDELGVATVVEREPMPYDEWRSRIGADKSWRSWWLMFLLVLAFVAAIIFGLWLQR